MMRALILAPVLLLGGCISLLPAPPPPPRLFVLEADAGMTRASASQVDGVLAVALPTGERSILGVDLVWRTGNELAFVSQSQWSNRADLALQSLLLETIQRQGGFKAVTRLGEARGDYEVRWEILDFEVAESSMTARFTANVSLLAAPGRRVVAQRVIEASAPVSNRSSSAAAQALTSAAREGAVGIGAFAIEAATSAQANAASISR